jgi:hypothetical protein
MEAHEHLALLGEKLRQAGFAATVRRGTSARLTVQNPAADALTEDVLCAPDEHGRLSFRWTWNAAIALVDDMELAVERISHVLKAVGL